MSEEAEGPEGPQGSVAADPAAMALGLGAASRSKADAYLDDQRSLIAIQKHHLHEQFKQVRLATLSQRLSVALKLATGLVGFAVIAGLGLAMWHASHAKGLVVEAFTVPPQLAANGLTGDVVADDLTDKIVAIRNIADAQSVGRSDEVQKESGEDIKVEIPETGISVAQAWRILRGWLGRERHLRGSLRLAGDGNVTLTLNGDDAASFSGPLNTLDRLEQQAAEHAYARAGSGNAENYVVYLAEAGRHKEAEAVTAQYATAAVDNRADWYALWASTTRDVGDMKLAQSRAALAEAMAPAMATPHMEIVLNDILLGHEDEALQQSQTILKLKDADQPVYERGAGFETMRKGAAYLLVLGTGDYADMQSCANYVSPTVHQADCAALAHDPAQARTLTDKALATESPAVDALHLARFDIAAMAGDWPEAVSEARAYQTALAAKDPPGGFRTRAEPRLALALAQSGDFAAAHRTIDATPADCYLCLRVRGQIDAAEKNYAGAAYWFARAVANAPSIPFAHEDWGRSLLAQGKPDEAIAQFTLANQKGSRFADPLEGWGEALMVKNQSHLALAKFAAAEKFAPNWGRLHLKWGEALSYAGEPADAKAQFARAATLDLTPSEKAELAQIQSKVPHG